VLLQALVEYAENNLTTQLSNPEFETKPVPYLLDIGPSGEFLGIIPRFQEVQRGKKKFTQPQPLLVPKSPVNRNSGLHPLLAADDAKYVFGHGSWSQNEGAAEREAELNRSFVDRLKDAATVTGDPELTACAAFYEDESRVATARMRLEELKPAAGSMVALSVMQRPVVNSAAARRYWADHFSKAFAVRNDKGGMGMCLISGRYGPIAPTHEMIKGLSSLGGQPSGVALMSFDKAAFRSYGWEKNANSPVSPDRAQAYVLALNDLIRSGTNPSRVDQNGVGYLFWTKLPASDVLDFASIMQPTAERVKALLNLDPGAAELQSNDFYMLGVSGNGARLLIRFWMHETLGNVIRNLKEWFSGLKIIAPFPSEAYTPPAIWQLLGTLSRDKTPPQCGVHLLRRALEGTPLGNDILARALARLRVEQGLDRLNPVRAGLVRLCINDIEKGAIVMKEELDDSLRDPAYLCGRLLAVYDYLQYQAQGKLNSSVADRYYTLASSYPALAFPKLIDLGLKHMRKLRGIKQGLMINLDKLIQEIYEMLNAQGAKFPGRLSLVEQGKFAIGFHHQRAAFFSRASTEQTESKENV
jgi:CRISPR-associated protein Csd1